MSGANVGVLTKGNPDPYEGVTFNQMIVWMDNYCKANPLSDVSEGGNELYIELERKSKRKAR